MNLSEVALLLGTVTSYDLRVQVDELKVRAWHESLDPELSLPQARMYVYQHYADTDVAITVSHINKRWRMKLKDDAIREHSKRISLEFEETKKKAAPPEVAQKYLEEIRGILNRGKDASLETNNGEVASDL
jgi:hypothetical protein